MLSSLIYNRFIYVFSNLLVIPATVIPAFDSLANLAFIVSFVLLLKTKELLLFVVCVVFIIKNNSNYRFNILIERKAEESSKSDYDCVYLYAWCTLLRYFLIGIATNQIVLVLK